MKNTNPKQNEHETIHTKTFSFRNGHVYEETTKAHDTKATSRRGWKTFDKNNVSSLHDKFGWIKYKNSSVKVYVCDVIANEKSAIIVFFDIENHTLIKLNYTYGKNMYFRHMKTKLTTKQQRTLKNAAMTSYSIRKAQGCDF